MQNHSLFNKKELGDNLIDEFWQHLVLSHSCKWILLPQFGVEQEVENTPASDKDPIFRSYVVF